MTVLNLYIVFLAYFGPFRYETSAGIFSPFVVFNLQA